MFGLLGPNGAGKTTTVEILEGYRRALGRRGARARARPRRRATATSRSGSGIVLQSCGFYPRVTVREAVRALRQGLLRPARRRTRRSTLVGLDEKADARTKDLSGGQRRRLDLALALIGDPELIFLDEPTTGFDPAARRTAWGVVRALKELGKTVLLTTHYLDEAQELADRVAIVKDGRIVAEGPPDELGPEQRALPRLLPVRRDAGWSTRPTTPPSCCTGSRATRWRAASGSTASRSPARRSRRSTSS